MRTLKTEEVEVFTFEDLREIHEKQSRVVAFAAGAGLVFLLGIFVFVSCAYEVQKNEEDLASCRQVVSALSSRALE